MRKKALRKDFYMEIRKSFGRFLSIFFIVAIGTAFFSGIRAAEPDMRLSGDAYFDQSKLMDLQVISTMGLTADDLQAIREIKGVEQAQPVYSMDALCDVDGSQKVVHIFSSQDGINELKAEKGRMPEKADECVADADFLASSGYQIGDKITFLKDEDDRRTDTEHLSDRGKCEQSGVHFLFQRKQYDRKRKCQWFYISTSGKLSDGCVYRNFDSGERRKRRDCFYKRV